MAVECFLLKSNSTYFDFRSLLVAVLALIANFLSSIPRRSFLLGLLISLFHVPFKALIFSRSNRILIISNLNLIVFASLLTRAFQERVWRLYPYGHMDTCNETLRPCF